MNALSHTYNGWKNKATWILNMYIGGNYSSNGIVPVDVIDWSIRETERVINHNVKHGDGLHASLNSIVWGIAMQLEGRQWYDALTVENNPINGITSLFMNDMLNYSLNEVDWFEIAKVNTEDQIKWNWHDGINERLNILLTLDNPIEGFDREEALLELGEHNIWVGSDIKGSIKWLHHLKTLVPEPYSKYRELVA